MEAESGQQDEDAAETTIKTCRKRERRGKEGRDFRAVVCCLFDEHFLVQYSKNCRVDSYDFSKFALLAFTAELQRRSGVFHFASDDVDDNDDVIVAIDDNDDNDVMRPTIKKTE